MEFFRKLFTFTFWFKSSPYQMAMLITGLAVVLVCFGFYIFYKNQTKKSQKMNQATFWVKWLKKMSNHFLVAGILLLMLLIFSYLNIQMFALRFWYVVWLAYMLISLFFLLKYRRVNIPRYEMEKQVKDAREKYMPPKRKK